MAANSKTSRGKNALVEGMVIEVFVVRDLAIHRHEDLEPPDAICLRAGVEYASHDSIPGDVFINMCMADLKRAIKEFECRERHRKKGYKSRV